MTGFLENSTGDYYNEIASLKLAMTGEVIVRDHFVLREPVARN